MRSKLFLTALILQFMIMISIVALAGQETRLGTGTDPEIYDDRVVWASDGIIHLYDITTKTGTKLNSSLASHPTVYEDKIVWLDNSSGNPDLCVYDVLTGEKFLITENVTGDSVYMSGSKPAIYGNIIVWQNPIDSENPENRTYEVYVYDLSTFTQTQISNNGCHYGNPDIFEDRIIWVNDSGIYEESGPIWMYNISTGNKTRIETWYSYDCAIYGDRLVSHEYGANYYTIVVYNLSTNEISGVNSPSDQFYPDIFEDRIVWVDERNCMSDVYMSNLSTGNETRVSRSGLAGINPVIYGDRIVWQDWLTNQSTIYMYDLSADPIKPNVSFTQRDLEDTTIAGKIVKPVTL